MTTPSNFLPYTPSCSQYKQNSGAMVKLNQQVMVGNCTPNNSSGNPQDPPYDFACLTLNNGKQVCVSLANGQTGDSANAICCAAPVIPSTNQPIVYYYPSPTVIYPQPGPRPGPRPPRPQPPTMCQFGSVNECAKYLDNLQGLPPTDSAGHFKNMTVCKNQCPNY